MCQYKTEKSKNIEISLVEVWLFWCETGTLSLNPKCHPAKLLIKCTGLKM